METGPSITTRAPIDALGSMIAAGSITAEGWIDIVYLRLVELSSTVNANRRHPTMCIQATVVNAAEVRPGADANTRKAASNGLK
jgi:hypothetical protein